jgi:hypothetical protein
MRVEAPHDKLFVFKPDELKTVNLATTAAAAPSATAPRPMPGKARSSAAEPKREI